VVRKQAYSLAFICCTVNRLNEVRPLTRQERSGYCLSSTNVGGVVISVCLPLTVSSGTMNRCTVRVENL
jgi:hypothetical protein